MITSEPTLIALLSAGFGLGLLHAFDADHIMAVSSLSSRQDKIRPLVSLRKTLTFCLHWAAGHGLVLLLLSLLVFGLGISIPESLAHWAERLVGVLLIVLGVWIIVQIFRTRLQLQVHQHGTMTHMHLTRPNSDKTAAKAEHDHTPVLVGITHGIAGSAPVLALVTLQAGDKLHLAISYVLLFSLGVACSMFCFGLALSRLQHWLQHYSQRLLNYCRFTLGLGAIGLGGLWISQSLA